MKKRWLRSIALLTSIITVAVGSLTGCSNTTAQSTTAATIGGTTASDGTDKVFRMAFAGDIVSFDPAYGYDGITCKIQPQVLETLLTFNAQNELVNQLITDWQQPDEFTYDYFLLGTL